MGYMKRGDFYEDDESIEDVTAAFAAGDKFLTAAPEGPVNGWTKSLRIPGHANYGDTYLVPVASVHNV